MSLPVLPVCPVEGCSASVSYRYVESAVVPDATCTAHGSLPTGRDAPEAPEMNAPRSSTRLVYVAGPIRAATGWLREQNIRRAEEQALQVWQAGAAALCPHSMSRFFNEHDAPFETWIRGDLEMLRRCDAVLMVTGWRASQGAQMERAEAERVGLPVFYSVESLVAWIGGAA